ncbi:hypothetical protein [Sandaracinus amylolyticus]|uniref:hypothetical protein n=1 Tax=Sandaracinus amylolyticus TaxID=927083 RepID=UPI001F24081F|nr:hypothetical protein [Sandaracinus amylolyticus]UJR81495.1 Hypothetical protein I5071_35550 [Sandaracinus amylolyticus]
MSLDRIIATGRGKLNARIEIEGFGYQPVTRGAMVQTLADGRERVNGLKLEGMKLAARLNLPTGSMEAQGFTVLCVDPTPARKIIEAFRKRPTHRTWLFGYISKSATTVPVFSTDGWPSEGVLHIGTEAIRYTGKTSTTFTGCTRGYWNSEPQAHFAADASSIAAAFEADNAAMAFPEVTDRPTTIEGRRLFLHLYGEGDAPLGEGTQRWQGVCRTSPKFEGLKVTFNVDPPTSILEQQIGGDVASPVGIRGIYYPWSAPFVLSLSRGGTAANAPGGTLVTVRVVGFFADQATFCAALTSAIATATAGWTGTIVARPTSIGFDLVYTTPSASQRWVAVNEGRAGWLAIDERTFDKPTNGAWFNEGTGATETVSVAASTAYVYSFASPVPRAYFGARTPFTDADPRGGTFTEPTQAATWPAGRIYLGGLVALSADMVMAEEGDPPVFSRVGAVDAANRWVSMGELAQFRPLGPETRFRLGRVFARGTVADLVDALLATSADIANAGAAPLLRESDIDAVAFRAAVAEGIDTPASNDRAFIAFGQDCTLGELLGPELVARGLHWTLSSTGQLGARAARLAAQTEAATLRIRVDPTRDEGAKPVGGMPTLEEGALWGFVSDLVYLTGYDPLEDEHTGPEVRFINVQARSPTRVAKKLELAQKSIPGARLTTSGPRGGTAGEPTQEQVGQIGRFWLGLLGGTYDILTSQVGAAAFNAQLGDAIATSSRYVPDEDGTLGVDDLLGVLIGFAWDLDAMRGTLEQLTHSRPLVGYSPEFRIDSHVGASDVWELGCNVAEESDQPIGTWFQVGDRVRAVEWNTLTPSEAAGTISSVVDEQTIEVTFDAPWDPFGGSTGLWTVRPLISDEQNRADNLGRFAFVAESTGRVPFADTTEDARVIAP